MANNSDATNFNLDFDHFKKTWDGLAKETKTADYFFTLLQDITESTAELKALYSNIETMIKAQDFAENDKTRLLDSINKIILPELTKDYCPYSFEMFLQDVKSYDEKNNFNPTNMHGVSFEPANGIHIIGARPGRGKTSLMASLALDAIAQGKNKVIFITLEENNKNIYTRVFNNLLFANAKKTNAQAILKTTRPRSKLYNTLKDPNNPNNADTLYFYKNIENKIIELEKTNRLQVLDFGGKSIRSIENFLQFHKDAIIFIDYLTLIRPDARAQSVNYEIADISKRLAECAKNNNQIIIAAAQLNRGGNNSFNTDSDKPEELNETLLRDSGQIEQDANTIIFLGRNTNYRISETTDQLADRGEPVYFWKMGKNRNGAGVNKSYCFDTRNNSMGFSFLQSTETAAEFLNTPGNNGINNNDAAPSKKKNAENRDPVTGRKKAIAGDTSNILG